MVTINVLLSGRLKLEGYGRGHPVEDDGAMRLSLGEGTTVREVVQHLGLGDRVAMAMLNARQCSTAATVKSGDRVILIPADVAALWRFLGLQNLGADSLFDFGRLQAHPGLPRS